MVGRRRRRDRHRRTAPAELGAVRASRRAALRGAALVEGRREPDLTNRLNLATGTRDELATATWARFHVTTEMVNSTWHHIAAVTAVGRGRGVSNAVERPALVDHRKVRYAAGG